MVAVLLYAYCTGERSSRRIERRCVEDVAYRVLVANQRPDHATLARFRRRHEAAIGELFVQVLGLCVTAGIVDAGLVALDGTKMAADASYFANRTKKQLVEEILAEAERTDAEEDERFGERRGDELPEEWAARGGRRERIREALRQIEDQAPRDYESKMEARVKKEAELGRKLGGRKLTQTPWRPRKPNAANVTDPDSRVMKGKGISPIQGYNAQAVATVEQFIVAAAVTNDGSDDAQFVPMVAHAKKNLRAAGAPSRVRTVVADAGYWSKDNVATSSVEALIAPGKTHNIDQQIRAEAERGEVLARVEQGELSIGDAAAELRLGRSRVDQLLLARRRGSPPTPAIAMVAKLATPRGRRLYKKRCATIEPIFGQTKHNRGIRRFARRGLSAVDSEWKLIAATHNILKLFRHTQPNYA